MRDLFESLQLDGEAGLQRLVDERTQENVTLDFKRKADSSHGSFERNDKVIFAELISGFANSAGGLGIWGIAAERDANDPVDCAKSLVPIANIEMFQSQAHANSGHLIMPKHEGIHIASVQSTTPGAGYLLVLVQRSERRPHRSEASGVKQYYKRAGDGFFAMEHYDIEDAFRRGSSPTVELYWELQRGGDAPSSSGIVTTMFFEVSLINSGNTLVRFPFLQIRPGRGLQVGTLPPHTGLWLIRPSGTLDGFTRFYGDANIVIHPGDRIPIARMVANYAHTNNFGLLDRSAIEASCIEFSARGGGENVRLTNLDVSLNGPELVRVMQGLGVSV